MAGIKRTGGPINLRSRGMLHFEWANPVICLRISFLAILGVGIPIYWSDPRQQEFWGSNQACGLLNRHGSESSLSLSTYSSRCSQLRRMVHTTDTSDLRGCWCAGEMVQLLATLECDHSQHWPTVIPTQLRLTTRLCLCERSCFTFISIAMAVSCVIYAPSPSRNCTKSQEDCLIGNREAWTVPSQRRDQVSFVASAGLHDKVALLFDMSKPSASV